jgi:hypothetical protein
MVAAITGARSHSLLFLDESARLIRSYGRFGRGPGEFAWITALFRHDDEVAVWDIQNRRVSLLAADGHYLRSVTLPVNPSDRMVGVFPDGSLVTTSSSLSMSGEPRESMRYGMPGESSSIASLDRPNQRVAR